MGPDKNTELFRLAADAHLGERLQNEMARREMLEGAMGDLSEAFAQDDRTPCPITEPTMLNNLIALNNLQRTHMGVAGTNPLAAVRFDRATGTIGTLSGLVAPAHDSFTTSNTLSPVHTRAIKITLNGPHRDDYEDDDANVEYFGLNLFIPDAQIPDTPEGDEPTPASSMLIVVGEGGKRKTGDTKHISGETPIIAVRNKDTGDAKVYAFRQLSSEDVVDPAEWRGFTMNDVTFKGNEAIVPLSDGQVRVVTLLEGDALRQVADEFNAAVAAIKERQDDGLTVAERAIARAALKGPDSDS
jgi:hypothetical protein